MADIRQFSAGQAREEQHAKRATPSPEDVRRMVSVLMMITSIAIQVILTGSNNAAPMGFFRAPRDQMPVDRANRIGQDKLAASMVRMLLVE